MSKEVYIDPQCELAWEGTMDMTFQEKSAWGLLISIGLVSFFYFPAAFDIADSASHPSALAGISIAGVIALVIIEAIYHSVIAGSSGSGGSMDERDAMIDMRSERNAGYVLAIGLFWLVGHIIATHSLAEKEPVGALTIAVWILFTLTASEVAKLIFQIWDYRADA